MTNPSTPTNPTSAAGDFISEVLTGLADTTPTPATSAPAPTEVATTTPAPAPATVSTSMLNQDVLKQIQSVALSTAEKQLSTAAPQLLKDLESYAISYTSAVLAGQHPGVVPSVAVSNADGSLTQVDAKNRSFRTLVIGGGLDVLYAVIAGIGALSGVNFFNKAGFATLGILVGKTLIQSVTSYVARVHITPTYQK